MSHPWLKRALPWILSIAAVSSARATSFVVPDDNALFHRADAVVTGVVLSEWSQMSDGGWPETVAAVEVTESIRGPFSALEQVLVHSPGGIAPGRAWIVHAAPDWESGAEVILFLFESRPGRWALVDLAVGKFRMRFDGRGRRVAERQADIEGTDTKGRPFLDGHRGAPEFVEYLRRLARGESPAPRYFVPPEPETVEPVLLPLEDEGEMDGAVVMPASAASAITYSMDLGSGRGARWTTFPSPVNWRYFNAGGVSGASAAMTAAVGAWNADAGSNVHYAIVGASLGSPSGLFGGTDGENTVRWEIDLPDIQDFSCSSGGTLGLGGITSAGSPLVSFGGGSFYTTYEADVDMNRGVACAPQDTKNTALAHELGHTLAFRHSDRSRDNSANCAAPLSCSTHAVMKAILVNGLNAALQVWDIEAARALYPDTTASCSPAGLVAINVARSAVPGSTANFASVPTVAGDTYTWSISGGTITSAQGGSSVTYGAGPAGSTMTLSVAQIRGGCTVATGTALVSVDFWDVPSSHPFREHVNTISRRQITAGCAAGFFCPAGPVLRSQMAVFLLRATEGPAYTPPPATGTMFTDVPAGSFAATWIEELARRGITGGCGDGKFCPDSPVTRAQMAVFLLKSLLGSTYVPPPAIGRFADVSAANPTAGWIEDVYVRGITGGCETAPLRYCPNDPITRGQMAVFLVKTFNL